MNTREVIHVREYKSTDANTTLRIFQEAIRVTASADYTPDQIAVWARRRDIATWDASMRRRQSYVAVVNDQGAGFSDISEDGYIDMLYVAPEFARKGVARELVTFLEKLARTYGAKQLSANVSITARTFFEAGGFAVVAEQHPVINDVVLTNFRMVKDLESRG